jgi:sulfite reductase alpha subunit-like flavoprotein
MESAFPDIISALSIPILYGTQTGTSRDVSEEIQRTLRRLGLKSRVCAMEDFDIVRSPYFTNI